MNSLSAEPPALILQPERPQDAPLVDALIARAFGPGRFTKVSERVREFATFAPELSICAWSPDAKGGSRLLGVARMWRVRVMPGPVDQRRVLVRKLTPDAGDLAGPVLPA